jgi:hypothetical protein
VSISFSSTIDFDNEVNLSNANAVGVLRLLGITPENTENFWNGGSLPAEDFLGRVLIALAVNPADAGVPATQEGNFIDAGRREGYFDERLGELRDIAEKAFAEGGKVQWG